MKKYAILDKQTNSVKNTIVIEEEKFLSVVTGDNEYAVPASRSVQIGMVYDKNSETFPEVHLQDQILDLKEIIELKIQNRNEEILKNSHLTQSELLIQNSYVDQLKDILKVENYDDMKSQFDSLEEAPEIPPPPKEITQEIFRSTLNISEKILWDNPEACTEIQKSIINTLKMEFPYYGAESMTELFSLLEENDIISNDRILEIKSTLDS
jgi:hypothetical protein